MIIGIAGKKRSGKDTVAKVLIDNHGFGKLAFADPIKRALCAMLSIEMEYLEEHKDERDPVSGLTYRYLMQTLGEDWCCGVVGKGFMISLLDQTLIHDSSWYKNFVITDIRRESEADYVRGALGGKVLHITRKSADVDTHITEAGIKIQSGDALIENDGTLEQLHEKIGQFVTNHL